MKILLILALFVALVQGGWYAQNDFEMAEALMEYECNLKSDNCTACADTNECAMCFDSSGTKNCTLLANSGTCTFGNYTRAVDCPANECSYPMAALSISDITYVSVDKASGEWMQLQFTFQQWKFQQRACLLKVIFEANAVTFAADGGREIGAAQADKTWDETNGQQLDNLVGSGVVTTTAPFYGKYGYKAIAESTSGEKSTTPTSDATSATDPPALDETPGSGDSGNTGVIIGIIGGAVAGVIVLILAVLAIILVLGIAITFIVVVVVVIIIAISAVAGGGGAGAKVAISRKKSQSLLPVAQMSMAQLSAPHVELTDL